jgi:hypothetical protein
LEAGISFQKVRRTVIDAKRILSVGENTPFSLITCGDRMSGMFGSMSVPFNAHEYSPIQTRRFTPYLRSHEKA